MPSNTPNAEPIQQDESILHFRLEGQFPSTHSFALNTKLHTLSHLYLDASTPYPLMLGEALFSGAEMDLLYPVITSFPDYTPYEVLLVSMERGYRNLTD